MKMFLTLVFLLVVILTESCTYSINSIKYSDKISLEKNDLFYHLPKTLLVLTVNYKVVEKTEIVNGVAQTPEQPVYTVKGVEVKTLAINDPNQLYVARGASSTNSFFMKENIDFKFNEKGIIQTIESKIEDKTLESIDYILKGVAAISTVGYPAGSGNDYNLSDLNSKITESYKNLANAINNNDEDSINKYKNQLKYYFELINTYNDKNKVILSESEVTYSYTIDPDKMITVGAQKEYKIQQVLTMPEIKLIIELENVEFNKAKVLLSGDKEENYVLLPGLIYNIPASLKTRIVVSTPAGEFQNIYESNIDYSQFGNLGYVPVTSKLFTSRNSNIEFNATTGTLTKFKSESGSSSESIGASIESNANLIKSSISDIKYNNKINALKKQKEISDLQEALRIKPLTDVDSLKNTIEILKLQFELDKIQNEIEEQRKK